MLSILASQDLVMQGLPASVSMLGDCGRTSKAKGTTILKKAEQLALCSTFENGEITIEKVHDAIQKSEYFIIITVELIPIMHRSPGLWAVACGHWSSPIWGQSPRVGTAYLLQPGHGF